MNPSVRRFASDYFVDHLGNLRVAVRSGDPIRDQAGVITGVAIAQLVQENHYDPWGLNLAGIEKETSTLDRFQFNGRTEKGLLPDGSFDYETPFRNYDATIGRFKSVDLLSDLQKDFSPFHFGYNNPVSFNDPSGLIPSNIPWGIVGAAVGYVAGGYIGGAVDNKPGNWSRKGAIIGATAGFLIGDIGGFHSDKLHGSSIFYGTWESNDAFRYRRQHGGKWWRLPQVDTYDRARGNGLLSWTKNIEWKKTKILKDELKFTSNINYLQFTSKFADKLSAESEIEKIVDYLEKYPTTIIEIKSNVGNTTINGAQSNDFNIPITVDGISKRQDGTPTDLTDLIEARNAKIYRELVKRGINKYRIKKRSGWVNKGLTTEFLIYEKNK